MNFSDIYVKKSNIHGRGLFAKRIIKSGALIGMVEGNSTRKDGPYVLWVNKRKKILVKNKLKYINHHPEPNACYYDDMSVVALQDIHPNQEITHNYGSDWCEE